MGHSPHPSLAPALKKKWCRTSTVRGLSLSLDQELFSCVEPLVVSGSMMSDQWPKKVCIMLIDRQGMGISLLEEMVSLVEHAAHAHCDDEGGRTSSSRHGLGQRRYRSYGGVYPMRNVAHCTGHVIIVSPWLQAGPLTALCDRQVTL